jgi:hypothetical protein
MANLATSEVSHKAPVSKLRDVFRVFCPPSFGVEWPAPWWTKRAINKHPTLVKSGPWYIVHVPRNQSADPQPNCFVES